MLFMTSKHNPTFSKSPLLPRAKPLFFGQLHRESIVMYCASMSALDTAEQRQRLPFTASPYSAYHRPSAQHLLLLAVSAATTTFFLIRLLRHVCFHPRNTSNPFVCTVYLLGFQLPTPSCDRSDTRCTPLCSRAPDVHMMVAVPFRIQLCAYHSHMDGKELLSCASSRDAHPRIRDIESSPSSRADASSKYLKLLIILPSWSLVTARTQIRSITTQRPPRMG